MNLTKLRKYGIVEDDSCVICKKPSDVGIHGYDNKRGVYSIYLCKEHYNSEVKNVNRRRKIKKASG